MILPSHVVRSSSHVQIFSWCAKAVGCFEIVSAITTILPNQCLFFLSFCFSSSLYIRPHGKTTSVFGMREPREASQTRRVGLSLVVVVSLNRAVGCSCRTRGKLVHDICFVIQGRDQGNAQQTREEQVSVIFSCRRSIFNELSFLKCTCTLSIFLKMAVLLIAPLRLRSKT